MNKLTKFFTTVLFVGIAVQFASSQTTAFNYQGRLTEAGNPANGAFQMQFKLFDAVSGGTQFGATLTNIPVTVTEGTFGVRLDFGLAALTGANRWIEIGIRHNSGESYTTLSPREQIASSPYAVRTLLATAAETLSVTCAGCVLDSNINTLSGAKVTGFVGNATNATNATTATNATQLGGVAASQYVQTSDSRLSDARNPLPGSSNYIQNGTGPQTGNFNITGNGMADALLVGTTSTSNSKLAIRTATNFYGATHTDGTATVGTFIGNGYGAFGTRTNHRLDFFTNGSAARMTIDPIGNIGIGTGGITTSMRLYLAGGPQWTNSFWTGSLGLQNGGAIAWAPNAAGNSFAIGQSNGGLYFFRTQAGFGDTTQPANYYLKVTDAGHLAQAPVRHGLVKAQIFVRASGSIHACYNSITEQDANGCGFTVTRQGAGYRVEFGFDIQNRYVVASAADVLAYDVRLRRASTTAVIVGVSEPVNVAVDGDFNVIVF